MLASVIMCTCCLPFHSHMGSHSRVNCRQEPPGSDYALSMALQFHGGPNEVCIAVRCMPILHALMLFNSRVLKKQSHLCVRYRQHQLVPASDEFRTSEGIVLCA